jgi:hypothetical protein
MKNIFFTISLCLFISCSTDSDNPSLLVVGTSIPAECPYVETACKNIGYRCINMALGSSGIVLTTDVPKDISEISGRTGKDLSETMAEKEARFGNVSGMTAKLMNTLKSYSYESRILPYLNQVDAIVFDHGYNDSFWINAEINNGIENINWNSTNRSTYIGAFNYLMWEIFRKKPTIKIIIGGYMENQSEYNIGRGKVICQMQEIIANHYQFSIIKVWEQSGMTFDFVPNSADYIDSFNAKFRTDYEKNISDDQGNITYFQMYNPDNVHPHTDKTGNALKVLSDIYTEELKKILLIY